MPRARINSVAYFFYQQSRKERNFIVRNVEASILAVLKLAVHILSTYK